MKLFLFINISLLLVGTMIYCRMKSSRTPSNAKLIIEAWDYVLKAKPVKDKSKNDDKAISSNDEKEI